MAMHAPVVIVCLKPLANPDAVWPSLLDFGVILWSFCIIILVILYYHSGHSVLSFWSFCIIILVILYYHSGHSVLSFWSFCTIILVILYYHSGHSVLSFWSFCIIILVILYYHSGHSVLSIQALYVEGRFARAVPLVIFGGLGVLAGLLALSLPETFHRNLPDTIKDAVNLCEWVQSSIHPLFSFSRQRINTQRS